MSIRSEAEEEIVPFIPDDRLGLYPKSLAIGELDDLGNLQVSVAFSFRQETPPVLHGYTFLSAFTDDGPGIVTSMDRQRLHGDTVGEQGASALLQVTDATLSTVTDPDAPDTIALPVHTVRLFLGGFRYADWVVEFEAAVSPFSLSGRWKG